jgi:hypothetical protein
MAPVSECEDGPERIRVIAATLVGRCHPIDERAHRLGDRCVQAVDRDARSREPLLTWASAFY